jgi:hypothetical protein
MMNEGGLYGWGISPQGSSMGGSGGRAPLVGTPKNMLSKALEMGICFHRGPAFGGHGEHSFPRAFERRKKFLYLGEFFMRNLREM